MSIWMSHSVASYLAYNQRKVSRKTCCHYSKFVTFRQFTIKYEHWNRGSAYYFRWCNPIHKSLYSRLCRYQLRYTSSGWKSSPAFFRTSGILMDFLVSFVANSLIVNYKYIDFLWDIDNMELHEKFSLVPPIRKSYLFECVLF